MGITMIKPLVHDFLERAFVAPLVVLVLVRHYLAERPVEQGLLLAGTGAHAHGSAARCTARRARGDQGRACCEADGGGGHFEWFLAPKTLDTPQAKRCAATEMRR